MANRIKGITVEIGGDTAKCFCSVCAVGSVDGGYGSAVDLACQ